MSAPTVPVSTQVKMLTGNEACAEAAIAAGMRFYAGYPITPSTEIAEILAKRLPDVGGAFIQMEDEIASMGAIVGGSLAGKKSMTATSGPGFSLMQENLGYASMAEVPCVVANVMRVGPSTGLPTMPSQGDMMQARWGSHGDRAVIALTPGTVAEVYELTIRAFNLSERYRTPVILLFDEALGHVSEKVRIPSANEIEIYERKKPDVPPEQYLPFENTPNDVPPWANFGEGYRYHVTGLAHDPAGFPTNDPAVVDDLIRRLHRKIEARRDDLVEVENYRMDDAEYACVAFGSAARSCKEAIALAREQGIKVGLIRPRTVWPFPDKEIRAYQDQIKHWLVVEMNMGQMAHEVEWSIGDRERVFHMTNADGELVRPFHIREAIRRVARA
jgi:2-oxoglutarate ferredoxin oxidoreductase subunit alpha